MSRETRFLQNSLQLIRVDSSRACAGSSSYDRDEVKICFSFSFFFRDFQIVGLLVQADEVWERPDVASN